MIPPRHFTAKLADKQVLNEKFVHYYFELVEPNKMQFEAGQYVSIAVHDEGHRRSYSICSSPEKDHGFELLVDVAPHGLGVQYLDAMKFGDEMKLLAPMGMFTVTPETSNLPLAFIATGSGVAPYRSMLQNELQTKHNTQPITLYWGLRHAEELFWEDEFEQMAEAFPNFTFHPVISQATAEWPLCRGRVTDCLAVHELLPNAHYFLCGSDKMIADMLSLLEQKGVPKPQLHREKFY